MADLQPDNAPRRLTCATVVRTTADSCSVARDGGLATVQYSVPFKPRAERVTPGQLVALAPVADDGEVVVWRWFDAVVIDQDEGQVRLWEPAHGEVLARPREAQRRYVPGGRAYASAGLPGAEWWVAGPVSSAGDPAVELDEVARFYTEHDLWSRLT